MGSGGSKHKQARAYQPSERSSPPGKPFLVPQSPGADPDVITIKWDPPIYGGGSKIIGYLVEHKRTVSPHWVKATPILVKHHQLSLSGLEPGMRYQFRVFAENSGGRSDSSPLSEPVAISHQRGVAIAPVFLKTLHDTAAIENEKVEFVVKVDGTPYPRISWYKDGFEVFSNRRQRVSTDNDVSSFVIHQAALSDEGEIKCSATNKAGHAVAKATLTLQAPPTIRLPRQYEDGILFELGEAVKLKVSISGRPTPQITWYHNGKPIEPGPRVECTTTDKYALLRVSKGTREDRGEYQVRATNPLGEDMASLLVTITDRPLPPGKVNVVMTLGRCVTLAWTIPYDDGGCKIGNYIVEYFRIGWNMWLKAATCRQLTTTIGDLIEGSEYKFRVKAENPYGISDPSEESDIIFIPDPKRGLLEPPPRGTQTMLDEIPEQWLDASRSIERNSEQGNNRPREDWLEDDSPIPSPVILANQVLQKVKMAPKRTWSEDSQGSPPREYQHPAPVPPRRKHRISSPQKFSPEPEEKTSKEKKLKHWEKEMSPRTNLDEDVHSSSEMMLVLLPNKEDREDREESGAGITVRVSDFDNDAVAPPMSLSAPELSSCEPFDFQELRLSASSSEIMHELALIRFNKEVSEEETEAGLKQRYGIERRRSFERRSSRTRDSFTSSKENLPTADQLLAKRKELLTSLDSKRIKRLSDSSDEMEERESRVEQFSERFLSLERGFKEYAELTKTKFMDDDESDRLSSNYSEEEYIDEETYHPRSMIPNNISAVPSLEPYALPHLHKPPMVTITEEPEPMKVDSPELKRTIKENRAQLSPDHERMIRRSPSSERDTSAFRRSQTPSPSGSRTSSPSPYTSRSPSPNIVIVASPQIQERHEPPSLPITPKPILKVRNKSVESLDSSQLSLNKKVRIELPEQKEPDKNNKEIIEPEIGEFMQKENDIGIAAAEVARSRRKKQPPPADPATKVIIDHYSDIVREYGQVRKPATKLYLSYEELKAAAERTLQEKENQPVNDTLIRDEEEQRQTTNELSNRTDKNEECVGSIQRPPKTTIANSKTKFYLEYMLDVFLFFVACWLYFFKDIRLTIPILLLMVYRQLNEAALKVIKFKPFSNKKN